MSAQLRKNAVRTEDAPAYFPESYPHPDDEDAIIRRAMAILERRMRTNDGYVIDSTKATREYLTMKLTEKEHEVFACLFLDNRHRVIAFEEMFRGTIDGASVHPREVVKDALRHNAAADIFAHNHPSGVPEPSQADFKITETLTAALKMVDVRVLDHIIIGDAITSTSFAERGLL